MAGPDISLLQQTIRSNFPHLWPVVDLALATSATLFLKDNANPSALVLVGPPAAGKNTVIDMFNKHPLTYRSDQFTAAAFVSNSAKASKEQLEDIDLLPRIQHKLLLTPELAPIFRGKEDDLLPRFNTLTRVLDGRGLMTDSGTHGQRGYDGDYLFAWLGGTTPFDRKAWEVMGKLGSRLLFYRMPPNCFPSTEDLVQSTETTSYKENMEICHAAVQNFLTELFDHCCGIRGISWVSTKNDPNTVKWIAHFAKLLAFLRTPLVDTTPDNPITQQWENPNRAMASLYNLARGHALVHRRFGVTSDDLPLIAKVVLSSIPDRISLLFQNLIAHGGTLTVTQAEEAMGEVAKNTARKFLEKMGRFPVLEFIEEGQGKTAALQLVPEWAWLANLEYARHLLSSDS